MKLIVAGASGFVAKEVVRQSLSNPAITSIIALARKPVEAPLNLPPSADKSKLNSVVIESYETYPDSIKSLFADADACIWTVAITPSKSKAMDFSYVRTVCRDYTIAGLEAMASARQSAGASGPFRFMYMAGATTERDQTKTPKFMPQYCLMRGEIESALLALAQSLTSPTNSIEVCVAKPGLILAPDDMVRRAAATVGALVGIVPKIEVGEVARAMIAQCIWGFEKEPLENSDLVRLGSG